MATKIFVNLPVTDLSKSMEFFKRLGYSFNPQFTDAKAACLIISDEIYAMLLTKPFFKSFIKKEVVDARTSTEVLLALAVDSREEVDQQLNKALAAGGKVARSEDYGYMYSRGFEDLDGHIWEIFWMDPDHIQK
jgi:predicted lactoylglutathione lyase